MAEQEKLTLNGDDVKPQEKSAHTATQKFLAEVLGTAALLLFPCYAAVKSNGNSVLVCLAFACTIVSLSFSFGNISGAHLNPAVSLNFLLRKKMLASEFMYYIVAQTIGAFLGSLVLGVILGDFSDLCSTRIQRTLMNKNGDIDGMTHIRGLLCEALLTFFFVLVINGSGDERYHDTRSAGMVVACGIVFVSLPGGDWTGCSMNPVRSLAPAVFESLAGKHTALSQIWIYFAGPFAGASLGAIVYGLFN